MPWPSDGKFRVVFPGQQSNVGLAVFGVGGYFPTIEQPLPLLLNTAQAPTFPVAKQLTGVTAAGNTTIWTPAAGKTIVVDSVQIWMSANASKAAGALTILNITDGNGGPVLAGFQPFVPGAAVTTNPGVITSGQILMPQGGYRLGAANNILVLNMSGGALATGSLSVNAVGWEA